MKPELLVLSGLPASGKSTYRKEWLAEDPEYRRYINYDELRVQMFGEDWRWNRKEEEQMKAEARRQVKYLLNDGFSVCVDNTNLSSNVRQGWIDLGKSLGAEVIEQEIDTPLWDCIDRDKARGKGRVGRAVIERMALFHGFIDWADYKAPIVICDIDGTVADCQHRLHHVKAQDYQCSVNCPATELQRLVRGCQVCGAKPPKKNWAAFHSPENISLDTPIKPIVDLVKELEMRYMLIFLTGRSTENGCGIATEEWLDRTFPFYEHLFMRQAGDSREDTIVKKEILDLLPKEKIAYVFEDRDRVVEMYRAEGLTVLQPKKGDY